MNCIIFNRLSDFNKIIDMKLVLTGIIDEEIEENLWAITLKPALAEKTSIDQLNQFIESFLQKKRTQMAEYSNVPATCYMWVDEQSFQLQMNIIAGHTTKLPFGCKVNLVKDLKPLLERFIEISKKGYISFDEVSFDQVGSDEEDDPANYTLDVYLELM